MLNKVCHFVFSEGLRPLTMSLFMFGVMIGAVVLGIVSDTVGRKPTTFATLLSMIITNQFGAWTDRYVSFTGKLSPFVTIRISLLIKDLAKYTFDRPIHTINT